MTVHEEVTRLLKEMGQAHPGLELPPKVVVEMRSEFTAFVKDQSLAARMPFDPRHTNPAGVYQGGMLCAAADNVFGPLSYLVAQAPTVTLSMEMKYVRPFLPKDRHIDVEAKLVSRTKQILLMDARIVNAEGKLVATASTQFLILKA